MIKSLLLLFLSVAALADTPPPGTVKAKTWTGDGNTSITAHGTSLDVNVTNSSGLTTVNQGTGGLSAWKVDGSAVTQPVSGTFWQTTQPVSGTFWQTTQPVSGTLTCNAGSGTQAVSLATLPALTAGAATIGAVNINGTVPVSGTFSNPANGDTGSTVPDQATQVGGVDGAGDLRALKVSNVGVLSVDASGSTVPVSGTFWQATQPVSGTFWQATQPVSGTITANAGTGTFTVDASGHTVPVSGTFWQATQPVSAASLPLPAGAATAAKQPALGTAGTASADVLTVQGIASMTALKVDGSAVTQPVSGSVSVSNFPATQPVSGTVTANIGTTNGLALDATVSALQVAQASTTSGQNGSLVQGAVTTAAPTYTTAKTSPLSLTTAGALRTDASATTQPVSGTVTANAGSGTFTVDGSGHTQPVSGTFWQATQPVSGTFWQATQPVSIATAPALVASSAIIGKVGIDQTTPGTTNGVQVNAALPAGSNVIGHVIVDTAPSTAVTQSGTWTVQPGNTANTTAWLVNAVPKTPAATTVKSAAITIGTTAVRLTNDGSAPPSTRVLLIAQLLSSSTANCYLGPATVTTTSTTRGVQMFAGQSFSFTNDAGDYYAICDATTQTFFITEQE